MTVQERLEYEKIYEGLSQETLLGMLCNDVSEYKDGLYELMVEVAEKKGALGPDVLLKLRASKEPLDKIQCPNCTESIPHAALVCPNCRRELYKRTGWGYISLGVAVFLCTPFITIACGLSFHAYAALVPIVAGIASIGCVVSGIKSLMQVGKPEPRGLA